MRSSTLSLLYNTLEKCKCILNVIEEKLMNKVNEIVVYSVVYKVSVYSLSLVSAAYQGSVSSVHVSVIACHRVGLDTE